MFIIFSFPFFKKKPRSIFNVFLVCIHLWYWSLIEIPHFVALDNIILPKYQFYSSIITTSPTRMPLVPTIGNRVAAAFWKMEMCSPYLDLTHPQKSLFRLQLYFIIMVRNSVRSCTFGTQSCGTPELLKVRQSVLRPSIDRWALCNKTVGL